MQCLRDVGVVVTVCKSGDVEVRYVNNSVYTINPIILVKVGCPPKSSLANVAIQTIIIITIEILEWFVQ